MRLFHSTTAENAAAIIAGGFKDSTGRYLTMNSHSGVWLSNIPLDENEGAASDALLEIELSISEDALTKYEWVEDWGKGYREWLVPAELINSSMTVRLIPEEEEWELRAARWF